MKLGIVSVFVSFVCLADANGKKSAENPSKPIQIGDHFPIAISSKDEKSQIKPVVSQDGKTSTYTLRHEKASYLSVHFKSMDLPPSCSLKIEDSNGDQTYVMRGKGKFELGTFWAHHVKGESMDIVLHCNGARKSASFEIDDYVAGYPKGEGEGYAWTGRRNRHLREEKLIPFARHDESRHLSICGIDDKRNAICYKDSHPTEYEKARAVARLIINGSGGCTGWLVSSNNLLLTNEHCIASVSDAQNTDFEFMAEEETCTTNVVANGVIFEGGELKAVSATWDYALIQLDRVQNPAGTYGHLELDNRKPTINEEIYIPQHPGIRPKEMGIFDSNHNGNCRVLGYGSGCAPNDMKYTCDTEGGSSGSPVLARSSHKVVALHHCGGACNGNLGAPIYEFYSEISQFLTPCESSTDCNDGIGCTTDICNQNGSCSYIDACPSDAPSSSPTLAPCTVGTSSFELDLLTDNYGGETTWTLVNECDSITLHSEGPYNNNEQVTFADCIDTEKKYTFTILDSYGDGICCGYGSGNYYAYYNDQLVANGGAFTSSEATTFGSCGNMPSPTPSPTPPANAWAEYSFDDFESGWNSWTAGGSDVRRNVNDAQFCHSGNYCIRLRDNSGVESAMTRSTNFDAYDQVMVKFYYYAYSMEMNEDFCLEVFNGSLWVILQEWIQDGLGSEFTIINNEFSGEQVVLFNPSDYGEASQIRFRCDASGNGDRIYIDDVQIMGHRSS